MQKFLSVNQRWESPIFLAGESYGGFRVGKLVKMAQKDYGIGLAGAILISPAMEFSLLNSSDYDALPWIDTFPDRDNLEGPDPTLHTISRVFTAGINLQIRQQIGLKTD